MSTYSGAAAALQEAARGLDSLSRDSGLEPLRVYMRAYVAWLSGYGGEGA